MRAEGVVVAGVSPSITAINTLTGEGHAFVAGLPSDFILAEALKKAEKIRLATAFARRSGWLHFRQGVTEGTGQVFLLTGLENCQTEPELLDEWLQLQAREPKRIEAKLASQETFFHPKVLIVTEGQQGTNFAIVGSGNLTKGGMQTNTECSVYVQDHGLIEQLTSWFDSEFKKAVRLANPAIKAYEPSYNRNRDRRKKLREEQRLVQEKILSVMPKTWELENALKEAKQYFSRPKFRNEDYPSRKRGAAEILKALKYPDFTFDKNGFKRFFSIGAFGRLNPLNRDKIFRSANRIKEGLRLLTADVQANLPMILNKGGKFSVSGFSVNAVTKFLAAYAPTNWPAFNSRVQSVLDHFGYPKPRGFSTAEQYIAYKQAMEKFTEAYRNKGYGELDAFALDAFFLHYSKHLEGSKGKSKSRS